MDQLTLFATWGGFVTGWLSLATTITSIIIANNAIKKLRQSVSGVVDGQEEYKKQLIEIRRQEAERVDKLTDNLTKMNERFASIIEALATQPRGRP